MTSDCERHEQHGSNEVKTPTPQHDANTSDTEDEEVCLNCMTGVREDFDADDILDNVDNAIDEEGVELDE
jgi:hypothetical protein